MFGDCHMHMVLDGVYYKDAIAAHDGHPRDDLIRGCLETYRALGVTYLRDGGDRFGAALRARALAGEYGIEYRAPVYPMSLKGRYGGFIGRQFENLGEYRAMVREAVEAKADFIKIMVSGLMDFDHCGVITSEPLTRAQIAELIHIAHEEGFAVMAHANGASTVLAAVEAGVDSVEHGAYMDEECVAALATSKATWVPTLSTIGDLIGDGRFPDDVLTQILEIQLKNVARCGRLGGSIALGSDAGAYRVYHGKAIADEYNLLSRALGADTERILARGEKRIRERFRREG